jgi:hypothetical protein
VAKRIRRIKNKDGLYTPSGLKGRLIAEEGIGVLLEELRERGYSHWDAHQLMLDVLQGPWETFLQVGDIIAKREPLSDDDD